MNAKDARRRTLSLLLALGLTAALPGCGGGAVARDTPVAAEEPSARYLMVVEDEPDTVDFQCTSIYYTVATNVFDRLVEMETDDAGDVEIVPSLCESWETSGDGRSYTFHLRQGVRFSNGAELTAADVEYTFTRLLTHPDSCNRDIVDDIVGAEALSRGETDVLEGFRVLDDLSFVITLEHPFEAFLACLSMPGASILDAETTADAGDRFGNDPEYTVGTGPFILQSWTAGKGMVLTANPVCWSGLPGCAGMEWRFMTEPEEIRLKFEQGELDIVDLDDLDNSAEFFLHGDIYQSRLFSVRRIAITYIALNEAVPPLDDVRVRRALQLGLNRTVLLDAVYGGRGELENGIFPRGLYGYNPDLPELPFDPIEARALLREAGLGDGFDLTMSVKSSSSQWEMTLMTLAAEMWQRIGVRCKLEVLDEGEFMSARKSGKLSCYTAMWTADFNDPDNFIYTFFGSRENATFRSLNYNRDAVMKRIVRARSISDPAARLAEYRELERIIVQEDAAWIPLFSREHYYVAGEDVQGLRATWNGSVKNCYRYITFRDGICSAPASLGC